MIIGQKLKFNRDSGLIYKSKEGKGVRSKGELELANFMHDNDIYYFYEPECFLKGKLWYPDFYLPKQQVYVEYEGMINDPISRKRYYVRRMAFDDAKYEVIHLYPSQFGNLGATLMKELKKRGKDLQENN